MAEFGYVAYASDGSHNTKSTKSDVVNAADRKEAEKLIRARYNYPVRIVFDEDMFAELGLGRPMFPKGE